MSHKSVASWIADVQAAVDLAQDAIQWHWKAADEAQRELKDLRTALSDLKRRQDERRAAVMLRWTIRRQLRESRALLRDAAPMPIAGSCKRLRNVQHRQMRDLLQHWRTKAAPVPSECGGPGVYALFDGEELVYIGQAVNVAARIGQHFGAKQFTAVSYVPVPRKDLDRAERMLLDVLRPRLNRDGRTVALRLELGRVEKH